MKKLFLPFLILLIPSCLFSQSAGSQSDTLRKGALNVFMEATDYIRKEIPYINYVRDIKDAGVYIIATQQKTGSGGIEYTYFFVGQQENSGISYRRQSQQINGTAGFLSPRYTVIFREKKLINPGIFPEVLASAGLRKTGR